MRKNRSRRQSDRLSRVDGGSDVHSRGEVNVYPKNSCVHSGRGSERTHDTVLQMDTTRGSWVWGETRDSEWKMWCLKRADDAKWAMS